MSTNYILNVNPVNEEAPNYHSTHNPPQIRVDEVNKPVVVVATLPAVVLDRFGENEETG